MNTHMYCSWPGWWDRLKTIHNTGWYHACIQLVFQKIALHCKQFLTFYPYWGIFWKEYATILKHRIDQYRFSLFSVSLISVCIFVSDVGKHWLTVFCLSRPEQGCHYLSSQAASLTQPTLPLLTWVWSLGSVVENLTLVKVLVLVLEPDERITSIEWSNYAQYKLYFIPTTYYILWILYEILHGLLVGAI